MAVFRLLVAGNLDVGKEHYIELGLQTPSAGHSLVSALRPVVDRALAVLADAIRSGEEHEDGVNRGDALREIERCRQLMAEVDEPGRIEAASRDLFSSCEATLRSLASQRAARRAEMSALIGLVREAVATIAGDNHKFDSSLDQSTARFEAMAHCNDLRLLKQQLVSEVTVLKRIATERHKAWEATVSVFEDRVATLERQLVSTRQEASLDPLTQIANRRTFDRMAQQWLVQDKLQFVLGLIDLDNFKRINDTSGHAAGDKVLLAVAQALRASLRTSDLVARFGGDEFAVLIAGVTLRQAESRLNAVAAQLAASRAVPGAGLGVTLSCGIAEVSAGDTIESLMRRADQALYDAKRRGKNRVAMKTPAFIRDLMGR